MVPDCGLGISLPEFPAWGLAVGGRASLSALGNSGQKGGGAIFSGFWFYLWLRVGPGSREALGRASLGAETHVLSYTKEGGERSGRS